MHDTEKVIVLDHSYSQHWSESYKADNSHANPISWILPKFSLEEVIKNVIPEERRSVYGKDDDEGTISEEEVDIESLDDVLSPSSVAVNSYDTQKAKNQINESKRIVHHLYKSGKPEPDEILWTTTLNQPSWSVMQLKLFNKLLILLDEDKLSRLSSQGVHNEAVIRRLSIDKSAAKLRYILSEFNWNQKLCQWLHNTLFNNLPPALLSAYLDIMQTLRSMVPALVERMILSGSRDTNKHTTECLNMLLKRPWEPSMSVNATGNTKNLRITPTPFLLFVHCLPEQSTPSMTKRMKGWISGMNHVGKVVQISPPEMEVGITLQKYLQQLAVHVQNKIQSIKLNNPGNPVVLVGWDVASIFNCHISLIEQVSAIVCLGFPLFSANGSRADVDDDLCDLSTPTLFVIGEDANDCNISVLENMRERLLTKAQTSLVAIAGANHHLCVSEKIKKDAGVTQSIVDKIVIERVGKFLREKMVRVSGSQFAQDSKLYDYMGKRRRTFDDYPGEIKKKKSMLSANMVSQIRDALAGHRNIGSSKDDAKSPVQGVAFNLQSGTVSGLTTVPTALGSRPSKESSSQQKRKHSKRKQLESSITIDVSKDAKKQINSLLGSRRESSDQTLIPNEQQTDAAVASILGMDTAGSNQTEMDTLPPASTSPPLPASLPTTTVTAVSRNTSPLSAFTRLSPSNISSLSNIVPSISPQNTSPQGATLKPGVNVTFGHLASLSAIATNSPSLVGTLPLPPEKLTESKKIPAFGKYSSYLSSTGSNLSTIDTSALGFSSSTTSARSSKDEKETMQATAILEQLSSGTDSMTSLLSRRHSLDPGMLKDPLATSTNKKTAIKPKVKKIKSNVVKRRQSIANPTMTKTNFNNKFKYVIPASTSTMIGGKKTITQPSRSNAQQQSSQFIIASPVVSQSQKSMALPQGISIMEIKPTTVKQNVAKPKPKPKSYPVVHFPQPNNQRINLTRKPGQGFALVSLPSSMFKTNVYKSNTVAKFTAGTVASNSKPAVITSSVANTSSVKISNPPKKIVSGDSGKVGSESPRGIVHLRNKALIINKKTMPTPSSGINTFVTIKKVADTSIKKTTEPAVMATISGLPKVISPVRVKVPIERQKLQGSPAVILKKLSASPSAVVTSHN